MSDSSTPKEGFDIEWEDLSDKGRESGTKTMPDKISWVPTLTDIKMVLNKQPNMSTIDTTITTILKKMFSSVPEFGLNKKFILPLKDKESTLNPISPQDIAKSKFNQYFNYQVKGKEIVGKLMIKLPSTTTLKQLKRQPILKQNLADNNIYWHTTNILDLDTVTPVFFFGVPLDVDLEELTTDINSACHINETDHPFFLQVGRFNNQRKAPPTPVILLKCSTSSSKTITQQIFKYLKEFQNEATDFTKTISRVQAMVLNGTIHKIIKHQDITEVLKAQLKYLSTLETLTYLQCNGADIPFVMNNNTTTLRKTLHGWKLNGKFVVHNIKADTDKIKVTIVKDRAEKSLFMARLDQLFEKFDECNLFETVTGTVDRPRRPKDVELADPNSRKYIDALVSNIRKGGIIHPTPPASVDNSMDEEDYTDSSINRSDSNNSSSNNNNDNTRSNYDSQVPACSHIPRSNTTNSPAPTSIAQAIENLRKENNQTIALLRQEVLDLKQAREDDIEYLRLEMNAKDNMKMSGSIEQSLINEVKADQKNLRDMITLLLEEVKNLKTNNTASNTINEIKTDQNNLRETTSLLFEEVKSMRTNMIDFIHESNLEVKDYHVKLKEESRSFVEATRKDMRLDLLQFLKEYVDEGGSPDIRYRKLNRSQNNDEQKLEPMTRDLFLLPLPPLTTPEKYRQKKPVFKTPPHHNNRSPQKGIL